MADIKISQLDSASSVTPDDIFIMVDDPDGSPATKKVSLATLSASMTADTGDISFSGVSIIGSGTIELVPDSGTYSGDQYLIIEPTEPNHIHIRTGGTIDNSNAELILGGENSYVKLATGSNPPVYVASNNNVWSFDTDGFLQLAASGIKFSDNTVQNTAVNKMPTVVSLGSVSGTINTDASTGDIFDLTITASGTIANPTNGVNGQTLRWRIKHNANSITINLGNNFDIPSSASSPLPFSTASGVIDLLAATYDSNRTKWDVIAFVPGY